MLVSEHEWMPSEESKQINHISVGTSTGNAEKKRQYVYSITILIIDQYAITSGDAAFR